MHGGLTNRLMSRHAAILLVRNTIVSTAVFAVDLALLWLLVSQADMGRFPAATIAFLVANTLHYALGRSWIFKGSQRGIASGYLYFVVNAGIGLVVTLVLLAVLMDALGMGLLLARTVTSVIAGLTVFLLNAVLNFRSV